MSTPTPRTDAEEWTASHTDDDRTVVWSDFARTLETDLAAARAEVGRLKQSCEFADFQKQQQRAERSEAEVERLEREKAEQYLMFRKDRDDLKQRAERSEAEVAKLKSEYAELQASRDRTMQLNREQAAEVAALREDKARLDWLETYLLALSRLTSPDMSGIRFVGQVHNPIKATPDYPAGTPTYLKIQGQTVRSAIDSARAKGAT